MKIFLGLPETIIKIVRAKIIDTIHYRLYVIDHSNKGRIVSCRGLPRTTTLSFLHTEWRQVFALQDPALSVPTLTPIQGDIMPNYLPDNSVNGTTLEQQQQHEVDTANTAIYAVQVRIATDPSMHHARKVEALTTVAKLGMALLDGQAPDLPDTKPVPALGIGTTTQSTPSNPADALRVVEMETALKQILLGIGMQLTLVDGKIVTDGLAALVKAHVDSQVAAAKAKAGTVDKAAVKTLVDAAIVDAGNIKTTLLLGGKITGLDKLKEHLDKMLKLAQ